jgi:hypothetical protein
MGTDIVHTTDLIPFRGRAGGAPPLRARSSAEPSYALTTLEQSLDHALVRAPQPRDSVRPRQLSWNGVRVSDELQRYAACVARGEELAPYRGPVLARPDAMFPWSLRTTAALPRVRTVEAPWSAWQVLVLGLLFVGVLIGGATSLLADDGGAHDASWDSAKAERSSVTAEQSAPEPRVQPAAARVESASGSSSTASRAQRATRTGSTNVDARPAPVARSAGRTSAASQRADSAASGRQASNASASAASDAQSGSLFVEAPSF